MLYPRAMRNRERVDRMERKLEDEMLRRFEGLTDTQRDTILHLIHRNAVLRHSLVTQPRVASSHDDDEVLEADPSLHDDPDEPFEVAQYPLRSVEEKWKDDREERRVWLQKMGGKSAVGDEDAKVNLSQKYAQFIDANRRQFSGGSRKGSAAGTPDGKDNAALAEMVH
ncbi:hypothetical protein HK104_011369, partial [Borealophlyctis nickersoniae]